MRAAIYNPYLDTLGGGERYTVAFAQILANKGYRVDIEWKSKSIKKRLEDRFGIKLNNVNFIKDVKRGDSYDICFWVSDGSIPLLKARKNFLHFQIPFKDINGKTLINKMKLFRINKIICNSFFTKSFIDKEYGVESAVIYPAVDVTRFRSKRKENLMISIGRFSQLTQVKRQDVLIRVFKKLYDSGYKEWRLILAGGVEIGVDDYVDKLRRSSKGYPIRIIESPNFSEIKDIYGRAKIFWSASGFGINENNEPMKVEHFGIAVVEAMAAGCVPIIYSAGGHKEIVADGMNGFLWRNTTQLINKTKTLIDDSQLLKKLTQKARKDSKVYEYERFEIEVSKIL